MSVPGPDTEVLDRVQVLVNQVPQGTIVEVDQETMDRLRADYCRMGYWLLMENDGASVKPVTDEGLIAFLFSGPGTEHRWALLADGSVIFDSRRVRGPLRVDSPAKDQISRVAFRGGEDAASG